jgi:hypothetical protein
MPITELDSLLYIPYLEGQASLYGCDCLGFISLCYQIDLKTAYGMTEQEGIKLLTKLGFQEDATGELALMLFKGTSWHLGIIQGGYIYHASQPRKSVVKDSLISFNQFIHLRFTFNAIQLS